MIIELDLVRLRIWQYAQHEDNLHLFGPLRLKAHQEAEQVNIHFQCYYRSDA